MAVSRFVISPAWLGGLSSRIPGEKSPFSPLRISNPSQPTPEQLGAMEQNGLLDAGDLTGPARFMLAALAETPSFSRVRVTSPNGFLDEAVYFSGEGAQSVSISNTAAGLVINTPGDVDAILLQISDFMGASARPAAAWSVTLAPIELLALAALQDLRRKAVLRAMPDGQPVIPPPGDPLSLANAIQAMWTNPQWFTASVQAIAGLASAPTAAQLQTALNALAQKKLAWAQNGSYIPATEAIQVADRFLLVNTIVTLDAGNSNAQGRVTLMRQVWLQSLISEMLHLELVDDQVRLEVVSPISALDNIRHALTSFDFVPAPALEVVPLSLVILAGVGAGKTFVMGEETVMGRSEQAEIHLLDSRASRRHAVIRKLSQGYQLNDAGSTNGTYLNGQFVTSPTWLHEGDEIAIGETRLKVFRSGEMPQIVESDRTVFVNGLPRPDQPVSVEPDPAVIAPEAPAAPPAPEPAPIPTPVPEPEPLLPEPTPPTPVEPASVTPNEQVFIPQAEPDVVTPAELVIPPAPEISPAPVPSPAPFVAMPPPAAAPNAFFIPPEPAAQPLPAVEFCARCHEPLQPGELVCRHCGEPVGQPAFVPPPPAPNFHCPNCGSPFEPGARFCGACGYKLAA